MAVRLPVAVLLAACLPRPAPALSSSSVVAVAGCHGRSDRQELQVAALTLRAKNCQ
jgi:hypothetical protein